MKLFEPYTEAEFAQYYKLRYDALRKSWNQPKGSEKAADYATAIHAMLLDEAGNAAGVCRLHFEKEQKAQLRFIYIREDLQNPGLGKLLLNYLEARARNAGLR